MNRTQLTLFVVLLAQVGLILLVRSPLSRASTTAESRALLPVLEAISLTRMEIDDARHINVGSPPGGRPPCAGSAQTRLGEVPPSCSSSAIGTADLLSHPGCAAASCWA